MFLIMSNQKTLDNFFKCTSNNRDINIKKYFYLDWLDEGHLPNNNAIMLDERPSKINFIQKIECSNIKKGYYFYICGNFKNYESNVYTIEKETTYKNTCYLTSLLQKSIRKQNKNLTIQSCYHLMKLNINDLLRRLPIIMLEDTYLHSSITTIIWLMVAVGTKKFLMKKYIYEWILGFSYTCCITKKTDKLNNTIKQDKNNNYNQIDNDNDNDNDNNNDNDKCNNKKNKNNNNNILNNSNNLNIIEYSILYALYFRIAYGGKDNDMKMIKSYIKLWNKRFHNKSNKKINTMSIKTVSLFVKTLEIDEWDLSAIDYHTNSNFTDFIFKKFPEITKQNIEKIIWIYSSSVNNRILKDNIINNINNINNNSNDICMKENWIKIKYYVEKTQKYLLESNI